MSDTTKLRTALIKRLNALKALIPKSISDYEATYLELKSIYGKVSYDIYESETGKVTYRLGIVLNDLNGANIIRTFKYGQESIPDAEKSNVVFGTSRNQHTVFAENMLAYLKHVRRRSHEFLQSLEDIEIKYLPRSE
jgi:hypothetical protein